VFTGDGSLDRDASIMQFSAPSHRVGFDTPARMRSNSFLMSSGNSSSTISAVLSRKIAPSFLMMAGLVSVDGLRGMLT
jgi:hypothetical protein